jgi:hypothetical protein
MLFKKAAVVLALVSLPLVGSLAIANSAQASVITVAAGPTVTQSPSVSTYWKDTWEVYYTRVACQAEGAWYVANEADVQSYSCNLEDGNYVLWLLIGIGIQ